MAETTVQKLAETVGTPVDTLLAQMKSAGLPHKKAQEVVSDEQKQQLLSHLRESHGGSSAVEPGKITLKRKSVGTIKSSSGASRGKTINVEVRKKRTYVKRDVAEQERLEEEQRLAEEEAARQEAEARAALEEARRAREEAEAAELAAQRDAEVAPTEDDEKAASAKAEDKARRLAVPKIGTKKSIIKKETPEQKAARLEAEKRVREREEERKRIDGEKRREAEEKAARETAAQAKKIAAELAKRKGDDASGEDEIEKGSSIVTDAREASWRDEERTVKRRRRRPGLQPQLVVHGQMKSSLNREHGFKSPTEKMVYEVEIPETIVVAELAQRMNIKSRELIQTLMKMGEVVSVNQYIDQETASLLVEELGHTPKLVKGAEEVLEDDLANLVQYDEEPVPRAPVVTIMGHVDHGKTSLLDYIRRTKVAVGEAGGITQHIGAYHVQTDRGMITFLDTPGHAAFTAMRARGAQATDIVIVVVAADDGVMPQTEEAINHAKAAGVPIIIAVNKIDKEEADPDRVRSELSKLEIISEEWGGDHQFVHVSAHTGEGVDKLLDAILLQAEVLELKAVPRGPARGVVIEARVDKGRGPVTSLLVQEGELNIGDMVLAGANFGRVRAMADQTGSAIEVAGPSMPLEVLGLDGVPEAGEQFQVVSDEKKAREVAEFRQHRDREQKLKRQQASKLENLFVNMGEQEKGQVNIVLKTDVRGSLEALTSALNDLGTDEVKVNIISSGVGAINESDVNLALTSNGVLLGFNVRADGAAKRLCEKEGMDLRYYSIIYELIDDVKKAMSGLLAPERREEILGVAEVRDVFRSTKFGAVAGCMVVEGLIHRNKRIRVLRDEVVVFEGELESLRRFKDDVQEVRNGMECGIAVKGYNDVKEGDKIEVFEVKEVARSL
jgi:translation initiation factor IF-2